MSASKNWILTRSKRQFYPLNPRSEDIHFFDIGFALSNICRYTGHVEFYSVAQHCVAVSDLLVDWRPGNLSLQLAGLLHDASEAYLCDVSTPVKYSPEFDLYRAKEAQLQTMIYRRAGCWIGVHEATWIKKADEVALATEKRDLKHEHPEWIVSAEPDAKSIVPMSPVDARREWFDRFNRLIEKGAGKWEISLELPRPQ